MKDNLINELKQKLTPDLIPYPYNEWAEIIGSENLYELAQELGGATVYIPKPEILIREVRNKSIQEEFTGFNYGELSKKYRLSERWIREICDNKGGK
ncbi:hypothetical protein HNQ80_000137 [Anaerosolibacter carboniphilus]|uniref:Mor transcription activator domain-containing protein n=1 Tax=Anaerosolibacter carboniphilus TaxID=1417629 RepID=A0A841KPP7_9FIRM|nr:Mor transcription activator family protein [Anaerosolibacter carboniphilus]MBB6214068.1 hypothetical protein [Anaerosolibacter carboniphilus]